jgi:hypothetical protein
MGFLEASVCKVPSPWGIILFIVNIIFPGVGTIISAFLGGGSCVSEAVVVGIIQLLTCWLIVGWIWSIIWGWKIYEKSPK